MKIQENSCLQTRKDAHNGGQIFQRVDLDIPSLQNCENETLVYATQSVMFYKLYTNLISGKVGSEALVPTLFLFFSVQLPTKMFFRGSYLSLNYSAFPSDYIMFTFNNQICS